MSENTNVQTEQVNTEVNTNTETNTETNAETGLDIEKIIQSAVDRATNKLGNENKKLRDQIDTLKKTHMTEAELKQSEIAEKEADIAEREKTIADKENRWFAMKAIKAAGLDDGSDLSLELVDFVVSDSEETTNQRVKLFAALVNKRVAEEVEKTFKTKGRNPEKSGIAQTDEKNDNNIAVNLGKVTAERDAAANKVLNHYLGGK